MAIDRSKLCATVERVVELLAARDFAGLERLSDSIRLTASQMADAVEPCRGQIARRCHPGDVDVVSIDSAKEECWSVNVRLHTERERPSRLTLVLTLVQSSGDLYGVEIEDIHVLRGCA